MTPREIQRDIGVAEKLGYGLGDFACNVVFQMVMMYMAYFYTDVFGLSAVTLVPLFLFVRIFDAFIDPIMGAICDRTSTRWGKFRPYLVWMSVPYAIFAVLTFTTPDLDEHGKLLWAYVTYALLMTVYTAINIPYCALGGVITADSQQRISLNSYRFALVTCAVLLIARAEWVVQNFGGGNKQLGYQYTMVLLAAIAVVMFLLCFLLTKERVVQSAETDTSFWHDIKVLLTNDQWLLVAAINCIMLIALVIRGNAAIYYVKYYLGIEDPSNFLTIGAVAMGLGAACASPLSRIVAHVRLFAISQMLIVAGCVIMYFVPNNEWWPAYLVFALVQFFAQMGVAILWAMLADTVDYGELKTGRRITGLVFSGALFSLKMGVAFGGAILAWMLAYYGYKEGGVESQSQQSIQGIVFLFSIVPAVVHLPLVLIAGKYRLNTKLCGQIRAELDLKAPVSSVQVASIY